MDVTKWKSLVVFVIVGSVCGCEQSNQPENRGDIVETDFSDDASELASFSDSGPLPLDSQTQRVLPSTGVTFEEVVPPFLVNAILDVGLLADGPGHRYLGHDDKWHYVAAGQSDRVLVAPVAAISPEKVNARIAREEGLNDLLRRGLDEPPPLSAAVQAFCESHSSLTTAPGVDSTAETNAESRDRDNADSPYPQRDGLYFVTVSPDLAFYALLQYPVDGRLLGNHYLGRDEEFHYIADEWDSIIWCCENDHIAQDDLYAVVKSQRERSDAFFDMVRENSHIPFASHPQQSEQRAWRESHDFIQLEDQ